MIHMVISRRQIKGMNGQKEGQTHAGLELGRAEALRRIRNFWGNRRTDQTVTVLAA